MRRGDARRLDKDAVIAVFERLREKGQHHIWYPDALEACPGFTKALGEWKSRHHLHGRKVFDPIDDQYLLCIEQKRHDGDCFLDIPGLRIDAGEHVTAPGTFNPLSIEIPGPLS